MNGTAHPAVAAQALDAMRADAVPTASRQPRADDFSNLVTGMGVVGRDPRLATTFYADIIGDQLATEIVRGDHIAAKVVDKPIDRMFRPGFGVKIVEQDAARDVGGKRAGTDARPAELLAKEIAAGWKRLGVMKALRKAMKWERKDGGAAILLGINDGSETWAAPLNLQAPNLKFEWLRVVPARRCRVVAWYEDPKAEKHDQPMIWEVTPTSGRGSRVPMATERMIHESRLIIFEGVKVTDDPLMGQLPGFGDSVLTRFYRVLRRYAAALDNAEITVGRFNEPVWKMADLAKLLAEDGGGIFRALVQANEYARSVLKVRIVDKLDDYGTSTTNVTGLPELIDQFKSELQAAADMPMTEIFGDSPGGLGDAGAGPLRTWYDHLASLREEQAIPPLEYITRALFYALGGKEPAEWEIEGKPFYQQSAKEIADTALVNAQIDGAMMDRSVVSPDDVARRPEWTERYAIDHDLRAEQEAPPDDIRETVETAAGGAEATPDGKSVEVQATALNGAQVASLVEVIRAVVTGEIPREAGAAVIAVAFQIDGARAQQLLGPVGWKPEAKPVPPGLAPFVGKAPEKTEEP